MAAQAEPGLVEGTLDEGEVHAEGGLPQMNVDTFAGQLFWLAVTFAFLFLVLSRIALPRIGGAIAARRSRIEGDLGAAETARAEADQSLPAYETALAAAKGRAMALAEESRKLVSSEVDKLKAAAEDNTQKTIAAAEARIVEARKKAEAHVRIAAGEAAADIVERLIGQRVSSSEAANAVGNGRG